MIPVRKKPQLALRRLPMATWRLQPDSNSFIAEGTIAAKKKLLGIPS